MEQLTAVIITLNEERNIGRCLESLVGVADEVVVVDAGSTDQTEAICLAQGVRFVRHSWQDYSAQKNYANSLASHAWVLSIDADEALSPRLRESILSLKREGFAAGTAYECNRLTCYCGHWVHHCGWYPDVCLRREEAQWVGVVHEELRFAAAVRRVHLQGDLHHYSYRSVAEHAAKTSRYALLAGEKAYAEGRRCGAAALWLKPAATFVQNYVLRGGWRDGATGFTICRMAAFYTFVKYARLRELSLTDAAAR